MENNKKNEENLVPKDGQNVQTSQDTPVKRRVAKAWYWMSAAFVLIVALIVFLAVKNSNNKKAEKRSLVEAVAAVNAKTPAVGATMVLDSVTYDAEANMVAFYNSILKGPETSQQLMRDYYNHLSDEDLKVLQIIDFPENYLAEPILESKASLKYVFSDVDGKVLKEILLSNKELTTPVGEEEMKRVSLVMIAQEAKTTQASCPQQIDENTTITGCQFNAEAAELIFNLTLSRTAEEIDKADFEKRVAAQKNAMTHSLSHDINFISSGVTLIYRYMDKNGKMLTQETITPKDYKDYKHDHAHQHEHAHEHAHHHAHD